MHVIVSTTAEFDRQAKALMRDVEIDRLIGRAARNPEEGDPIGGGLRKSRFPRPGAGKSGGYRVIRLVLEGDPTEVVLMWVYAKNEKSDLTPRELGRLKNCGKKIAESERRLK